MTRYQKNLLDGIKTKHKIDDIINMSWSNMEDFFGYKISKNTYKEILNNVIEQALDDEFMGLIPLMESSSKDISFVKDKIISAIKNRWYLAVYYEDEDGNTGFRLIEPYVVGRGYRINGVISENHTKDYYLRCFVVKDAKYDKSVTFKRNKSFSFSREEPYWRVFRLDRILNLVVIKRKIRWYRPQYTGGSDENIVERMEWANIRQFAGENPYSS